MAGALTELTKFFADPGDRKQEAHNSSMKDASLGRDVNTEILTRNKATAAREAEKYEREGIMRETAEVIQARKAGNVREADFIMKRPNSFLKKAGFVGTLAGPNGSLRFVTQANPNNPEMGARGPTIGRELTPAQQEQLLATVYPRKMMEVKQNTDIVHVPPTGPVKRMYAGPRTTKLGRGEAIEAPGQKDGLLRNPFGAQPLGIEQRMVDTETGRIMTPGQEKTAPSKWAKLNDSVLFNEGTGKFKYDDATASRGGYSAYWGKFKASERRQRLNDANGVITKMYGGAMDSFGTISLPPENREEALAAITLQGHLQRTGEAMDATAAATAAMEVARAAVAAGMGMDIIEFYEGRGEGMSTQRGGPQPLPRAGNQQGMRGQGQVPLDSDNSTLLQSLLR